MAEIFLEGAARGSNSKELQIRCREGFRRLLEASGFSTRLPRLFASGSRSDAYRDFCTAHKAARAGEYVALWIDSEDPISPIDKTWKHLKQRDNWDRPAGAFDEQVLLMATSMETLIVADHATLSNYYGTKLQKSALPSLTNLEARNRRDVQDRLEQATKNCSKSYAKGKPSFDLLGRLNPETLKGHLPSFERTLDVLERNL